ncbi:hypothetical protein ACQYRI_17170 [Salmonella enterica]
MQENKYAYLWFFLLQYPLLANAVSIENTVHVSEGPFAKIISFNSEQDAYSNWWKKEVSEQLNKPVNFSGHYRLYVTSGGHGAECLHDYWVCGWVIDKLTGKVVSTLPHSPEGGNSYVEAVDNGTPAGLKFKYIAHANSAELTIQGRAANAPLQSVNENFEIPECRLITYKFNGVGFDTLNEVTNGCNLSEPNVVYGH